MIKMQKPWDNQFCGFTRAKAVDMNSDTTRWVTQLLRSGKVHSFYISKTWVRLKNEVLAEQHHECQRCKSAGRYKRATTVHHVKHLRKSPHLALVKANLEALCDECHYEEHHKKRAKLTAECW